MSQPVTLECVANLRQDILRLQLKLDLAKQALEKISNMPEDSLWMDDRDDAADTLVELAAETLKRL